jgi:hypothetical protein
VKRWNTLLIITICSLISLILILLTLNLFNPLNTPSDSTPNVSETFGAESNPTGSPIGGGAGYADIITKTDPRVKFVVSTRDQLVVALQNARAGDVVYVEETANIDLTGLPYTPRSNNVASKAMIPAGVTLASNRGENGSPGGRIYTERVANEPRQGYVFALLSAGGANVRVTGLRVDGPDHTTQSTEAAGIGIRTGIVTNFQNLEVDNCEIYGFSDAGIYFREVGLSSGGHIHHNYIHECQSDGYGYGVTEMKTGEILVEANIFDYYRHAISGSGYVGESYEACYNLVLEHSTESNFDMHPDPSGTGYAGDWVKIHHNTFRSAFQPAVNIRGMPRIGAYIDHNWFAKNDLYCFLLGDKGNILLTSNQNIFIYSNYCGMEKIHFK